MSKKTGIILSFITVILISYTAGYLAGSSGNIEVVQTSKDSHSVFDSEAFRINHLINKDGNKEYVSTTEGIGTMAGCQISKGAKISLIKALDNSTSLFKVTKHDISQSWACPMKTFHFIGETLKIKEIALKDKEERNYANKIKVALTNS